MATSTKQLKAATPEQRSAFLDHLQTRERMLAQKRWAILKSLSAGPPPRPDWKEVALIMGTVTAKDEEGAVRRACNTVEVRVKRLRRALYDKALSAQASEGSDDA